MADTPRQLTALQALLADNTAGDISPQDLRDFLVTALGTYAIIYVDDGAVEQAAIGVAPALLVNWAIDGPDDGITADQANNKIILDIAGKYLVMFQVSFTGTGNTEFEFELYVDAVATGYRCSRKLGAGGDVGSASFLGLVDASALDDLEVYVNADGAAKAITVQDAQLYAKFIG